MADLIQYIITGVAIIIIIMAFGKAALELYHKMTGKKAVKQMPPDPIMHNQGGR